MISAAEFLKQLERQPFYQDQLVHVETLPPRRARYGKLNQPLDAQLGTMLKAQGVKRLFSHQARAINVARAGEHLVIATGTASGKSLCYNLPVLEATVIQSQATAIYLFPTKALAHDQFRTLHPWATLLQPTPVVATFDGDTPQTVRSELRRQANILLTNPDMLHLSLLPNHEQWANFLRNLKFVVLDEAHSYRGVFGGHVAMVLRRLNRLCQHYGSQPQYIAASATIDNPAEHVARLTGFEPLLVNNDGAPKPGRLVALWNPPLLADESGARRSAYGEAAAIFAALVQADIRNITFTRARVVAELILRYAKTLLAKQDPTLAQRVAAYRAGYLAEHRREIEQRLLQGSLLGVTATNALELGIDIGGLDAVVSVGYPGSIASVWQQIGRSGRHFSRKRQALALLIGQDHPLDQFFMRHPHLLFEKPAEKALLPTTNPYLLTDHLQCAAQELPLAATDEARFGGGFVTAMIELENAGQLIYQPDRDQWDYMGRRKPSLGVNIRSIGQNPVQLQTADGDLLETIDLSLALTRLFPGAIYIHQGNAYQVRALDLDQKTAILKATEADYYTRSRSFNRLEMLAAKWQLDFKHTTAFWGAVNVVHQVIGYRKIKHFTQREGKENRLSLPSLTYQTKALWWFFDKAWRKSIQSRGWDFGGSLQGVANAVTGILPLFTMCDVNDINSKIIISNPDDAMAYIFIYDTHPGGVGITEQGFKQLTALWLAALQNIQQCPCEAGCPSCVLRDDLARQVKPHKKGALWILQALRR